MIEIPIWSAGLPSGPGRGSHSAFDSSKEFKSSISTPTLKNYPLLHAIIMQVIRRLGKTFLDRFSDYEQKTNSVNLLENGILPVSKKTSEKIGEQL